MTRILVVYGTTYGQTAKIAARLRQHFLAAGADAETMAAAAAPAGLRLGDYDGVVVGASLIGGRYQAPVAAFVRAHREALNRMPSAFFAVSGSAGSSDPAVQAEAGATMEVFLARLGWRPRLAVSLAGAMAYSRYNPFLRFVIRRIARRQGAADTRHDVEMTDWNEVARFAAAFHATLPRRAPSRAEVGAGSV